MESYSTLLYFLAVLIAIIFSSLTIKENKKRVVYLLVPLLFFALKYGLILLNENYGIFGAKIAGNFTIDLYEVYREYGFEVFYARHGMINFRPQLLANLLVFELLGSHRGNLLLTNAILTTAASMIAFFSLKKLYNFKVGWISMLLVNLYPAAINFSFFGLRDPVIYFGMILNIVSFIGLYKTKKVAYFVYFIISLLIILPSRPELAAIIFFPQFFLVYFILKDWYFATKKLSARIFMTCLYFIFFVVPSLGVVVAGYVFVVGKIGRVVSPIELMDVNAELRYSRAEKGKGGMSGSHILPPNIYKALPWYGRWPIQTIGIIILPFPWMITSVSKVLAFADSIFLIFLMFVFLRYRHYLNKGEYLIHFSMFLSFLIGLLVMGMIISNAGNAFRMRLTIAPYILIPTAVYIGALFEKTGFSRILKEVLRPAH